MHFVAVLAHLDGALQTDARVFAKDAGVTLFRNRKLTLEVNLTLDKHTLNTLGFFNLVIELRTVCVLHVTELVLSVAELRGVPFFKLHKISLVTFGQCVLLGNDARQKRFGLAVQFLQTLHHVIVVNVR
jgi:hypothetical protein